MSEQSLGQAVLELVTDGAALEHGLDAAKAKAQGWSLNVSGIAKGAALAIAGVGAAAAGIVGSMIAGAHSIAGQANEIARLRRESGLTTAEQSKLSYAANRLGIDNEELSKSFGKLSVNLESAHPALAKYNIEVAHTKDGHIDMLPTLGNIADRFKSMPDGVEKTSIAMNIFGKQGKDLIPLLNQGSDGLKAMGDEAEKLGLVFDDKALAAAKRLTNAHKDLDDRIEGLRNRVSMNFLPIVADWSGALVNAADIVLPSVSSALETVTGWGGSLAEKLKGPLTVGFDTVKGVAKTVSDLFGDLAKILHGDLAPEAWSLNGLIGEDKGAFVLSVIQHVTDAFSRLPGLVGGVIGSVGEIFDVLTGRRPDAGGTLAGLVGQDKAAGIMHTVAAVRDAFTEAFDTITPVVQRVIDKIVEMKQKFDDLPPSIKTFGEVFAGATIAAKATGLDSVVANVGQAVGGFAGVVIPAAAHLRAVGFVGLLGEIGGALGAVGVGLAAALLPALAIGTVIAAIYLLVTHWDELVDTMRMLIAIAGYVKDRVFAAIGEMFSAIGSSIHEFLGFWVGAWDDVSSKPGYYLGLALGFVIGGLLDIAQAIGDFVGRVIKTIGDWLGGLGKSVGDTFTDDLPLKIFIGVTQMLANIVQFGIDAVTSVSNWIGETQRTIANFFVALPGQMLEYGKDIVTGLWNGVTGMASWIQQQIQGFVGGILDGIRAALGWPHSPAPATIPLGESIVSGIGKGIENTKPTVIASIHGLISELTTQAAAGAKAIGAAMVIKPTSIFTSGATIPQFTVAGPGGTQYDPQFGFADVGKINAMADLNRQKMGLGAIEHFTAPASVPTNVNLNLDGRTVAKVVLDRLTGDVIASGGTV